MTDLLSKFVIQFFACFPAALKMGTFSSGFFTLRKIIFDFFELLFFR